MGFVACLRFSDKGGAILGDEESWHLRRNKTYINDPVHALVAPEDAERHGVDLLYAGAGTTGFHKMVVETARRRIAEALSGRKPPALLALARIVNDAMAEAHRVWRDNRLKLYFDLDADAILRGAGKDDQGPFDIASDEAKKKARRILNTNEDGGYHNKNHALLIGYDRRGFNMFCLKSDIGVLSYVSTGFDVLGKGIYGSAGKFREHLENMTLKSRRRGMDRVSGLYILLSAALGASEYYNEAGGTFHFAVIDREPGKGEPGRIEVRDARARLARELVWGAMNGLLPRESALALLDRLVYAGEAIESVDAAMYGAAPDPALLDHLLRGYKIDGELRDLASADPLADPPADPDARPKRGRPRKVRGGRKGAAA